MVKSLGTLIRFTLKYDGLPVRSIGSTTYSHFGIQDKDGLLHQGRTDEAGIVAFDFSLELKPEAPPHRSSPARSPMARRPNASSISAGATPRWRFAQRLKVPWRELDRLGRGPAGAASGQAAGRRADRQKLQGHHTRREYRWDAKGDLDGRAVWLKRRLPLLCRQLVVRNLLQRGGQHRPIQHGSRHSAPAASNALSMAVCVIPGDGVFERRFNPHWCGNFSEVLSLIARGNRSLPKSI